MTRASDANSCPRHTHPHSSSERVPSSQAPDAVELSPDAKSQAYQLSHEHNFVSSWIDQHASPCTISRSSTPSLQHYRSASHPPGRTASDATSRPYAQALNSRILSTPAADVDRLSDAFPHHPHPAPAESSANSAQGEPSSQESFTSMHSFPTNQPVKSKQHANQQRARSSHQHHHAAGGSSNMGHVGFTHSKGHLTGKQARQNHRKSNSGSGFSNAGGHHGGGKSSAATWRSNGQNHHQLGHPPAHPRPPSSFETRHLSSPPCLPQQPPPPALPEGYAVSHRHSDRNRSIHYSHPTQLSYSNHDRIPGPPPLPDSTAASAWGHRPPPPPPSRHSATRSAPPPPQHPASGGMRTPSQPASLHASPHPEPLAMPQHEVPPAPPLHPAPPHERPLSDFERFLHAVDRLWAAPPPPPAQPGYADSLSQDAAAQRSTLESARTHMHRQPSDTDSLSAREMHRPCTPVDHSAGSEGNDTLDSAMPETTSGAHPHPATLAEVWGRMQECSAFGLEVQTSANGRVGCSYFVPHLSALHIVATVPHEERRGGLDALFDDGGAGLRGGRVQECAVDEAATDGTAEDSATDAHGSSGESGDSTPSPEVPGGMFLDSSGFLHSGAPSTTRGSIMHDVCGNTESSQADRSLSRSDVAHLPTVFSSRVDEAVTTLSPRAMASAKASLRLVANWAAEGPTWDRPPLYLHIQELCSPVAVHARQGGGHGDGHPSGQSAPASSGRAHGAAAAPARGSPIPCPASLWSTPLRNVHPSSWFAVLWHPLCRIPDSELRARFITYHEVGCAGIEPLLQHGSGSTAGPGGAAQCGLAGGPGSGVGPPPLATGMEGAPRIVGALVDIGEDGGNWLSPTVVGPDGAVRQCVGGDDPNAVVAMLRGAADALSRSTLFAEMQNGPQALPFVHHDHKFISNLQDA